MTEQLAAFEEEYEVRKKSADQPTYVSATGLYYQDVYSGGPTVEEILSRLLSSTDRRLYVNRRLKKMAELG